MTTLTVTIGIEMNVKQMGRFTVLKEGEEWCMKRGGKRLLTPA